MVFLLIFSDFGLEIIGLFVLVGVDFYGFEDLLAQVYGVSLLCEEDVSFTVGHNKKRHSFFVGFCFPDKIFHICAINESVCAIQSIFVNAPNH